MNKILKILILVFVLAVFVLTSAYVYLCFKGKDLIIRRVEQELGQKITFKSIGFSYPLTINVHGLGVEGYGSAKQAAFSLSLPHLFLGEVHFSKVEITSPSILLTRRQNEKISFVPGAAASAQAPGAAIKAKTPGLSLYARSVIIHNGTFNFFESSGSEARASFGLRKVEARIEHVAFPVQRSWKTSFHLKAFVSGFGGRLNNEELAIAGWADLFKKDMLARVSLTGADGRKGLSVDLESLNNDMTVQGAMSLNFRSKTSPAQGTKDLEGLLIQAAQASGANVDLKFRFKTKMDDFRAEKISLSGEVK